MIVRANISDERGFSLVEVLMTILVGMIVLAAALEMLTNGFTSSAKVQDRHDAAGRARQTLDRATALLQAQQCNGKTSPVVAATKTSVTFTANLGGVTAYPTQYMLWYEPGNTGEAGTFRERTWSMGAADGNGYRAPAGYTDRVLVDRVVPPADGVVFRYYGTDNTIDYTPLVGLMDGTGTISDAAKLKRVLNVRVALRILPTRTKTLDDKTSSLIEVSPFVNSNLDPTKLDQGPQC